MGKRILILQGHPDCSAHHFCHALADAYASGARAASHEVRVVDVARIAFPLLRSKQEWDHGQWPPALLPAQRDIAWAEHLVIVYPLWLGDMPAILKGFLEQVARPGFAVSAQAPQSLPRKFLRGRSAHVVVTMGMPALLFRWYFGAHSLKALKRSILGFAGVAPIRDTLVGSVEAMSPSRAAVWLAELKRSGRLAR